MQFGIFYEHQLPRPWSDRDEHRLFKEALAQVELADRLGIDYAWEVDAQGRHAGRTANRAEHRRIAWAGDATGVRTRAF